MPNTIGKDLLKNIYLFKDLSSTELEMVMSIVKIETFHAGDELFIEGDAAHSLYVIRHGSVKIHYSGQNDRIDAGSLGSGSHFGELAFITEENRSASVEILEKTEMICIEFSDLRRLLDSNLEMSVKVYKSLCHFLAGRLRLTTIDLTFAREKNLRHF